ncbi:MAG TPA: hypothetical protein VH092_28510 [Urbifossiella sp.]|jgi:hypothetical protein|nr:hypothetical protein [Urbifossiella sp.]
MTRFGLVLGLAAVIGLSAWGFARATDGNHARAAESAPAADAAEDDSNHDEAVHRYRTNQSRHWRHVMIGSR